MRLKTWANKMSTKFVKLLDYAQMIIIIEIWMIKN